MLKLITNSIKYINIFIIFNCYIDDTYTSMVRAANVRFGKYMGKAIYLWLDDKECVRDDLVDPRFYDTSGYNTFLEQAFYKYPDLIDYVWEHLTPFLRKSIPAEFQPGTRSQSVGNVIYNYHKRDYPDSVAGVSKRDGYERLNSSYLDSQECRSRRVAKTTILPCDAENSVYDESQTESSDDDYIPDESESDDSESDDSESEDEYDDEQPNSVIDIRSRKRRIIRDSSDEEDNNVELADNVVEDNTIFSEVSTCVMKDDDKEGESQDEIYYISRVIDYRYNSELATIQYLVKWKNYPSSDNSWITQDDFVSLDMVREFWKRQDRLD